MEFHLLEHLFGAVLGIKLVDQCISDELPKASAGHNLLQDIALTPWSQAVFARSLRADVDLVVGDDVNKAFLKGLLLQCGVPV